MVSASLSQDGNPSADFDYDLVIIGAGVGGHGAGLHAVEKGLKIAIIEGDVIGGTCVNRGCVPSKALLTVAAAGYDRQTAADHANNLASKIRNNLTNSMKALGVDILTGVGTIVGPQKVKYGKVGLPDTTITVKDIIIATCSVAFVPKGVEVDGKTILTSDHALKLESVPEWLVILGSGCIGLEFSDVYTALGTVVTFVEALDQLMLGFDPEIGKLAQRVINPRKIDYHTGVFVSKITPKKDGKPVIIELIDAETKEPKDTLEHEDWDDREYIPDPEDKKPEGYDDIPKEIPDADAIKPDDWDDEEDGEWTAPTVPNPEYKGPWKGKKIKNPAYKGKWKAPLIDSPDFRDDPEIYVFPKLKYVGIELWQVKSGTLFDNVLISDDPEYALKLAEETWGKNKDAEKAAFDEEEKKREAEESKEDPVDSDAEDEGDDTDDAEDGADSDKEDNIDDPVTEVDSDVKDEL